MAEAKQTVVEFEVVGNTGVPSGMLAGPKVSGVDVAYCLSKLNHRLYRQGRQYTVKVDARDASFYGSESIHVFALMPTWYLRSAWRMAKKAYDEAMSDEMEALNEGNLARWRDFRVGSGIDYPAIGDLLESGGENPINFQISGAFPLGAITGTEFTAGEYNLSYANDLDSGVNRKFWLSGGNADFLGIFEEYAKSRNESASPETVITEMPYKVLKSDANSEDYQELQANGNEPPYNADTFPNAIWVRVGTLERTSEMQRLSTGFFTAPLGMVMLCPSEYVQPVETVAKTVHITVKEGAYLGVHAPSM